MELLPIEIIIWHILPEINLCDFSNFCRISKHVYALIRDNYFRTIEILLQTHYLNPNLEQFITQIVCNNRPEFYKLLFARNNSPAYNNYIFQAACISGNESLFSETYDVDITTYGQELALKHNKMLILSKLLEIEKVKVNKKTLFYAIKNDCEEFINLALNSTQFWYYNEFAINTTILFRKMDLFSVFLEKWIHYGIRPVEIQRLLYIYYSFINVEEHDLISGIFKQNNEGIKKCISIIISGNLPELICCKLKIKHNEIPGFSLAQNMINLAKKYNIHFGYLIYVAYVAQNVPLFKYFMNYSQEATKIGLQTLSIPSHYVQNITYQIVFDAEGDEDCVAIQASYYVYELYSYITSSLGGVYAGAITFPEVGPEILSKIMEGKSPEEWSIMLQLCKEIDCKKIFKILMNIMPKAIVKSGEIQKTILALKKFAKAVRESDELPIFKKKSLRWPARPEVAPKYPKNKGFGHKSYIFRR